MDNTNKKKTVVLLTINAWGVSSDVENNAIRKAKIEDFKDLVASYPSTIIKTCSDKLSENYRILGLGLKSDNYFYNKNSLSKIIDQNNFSQIKIADSENFPLVSVFFNNQEEKFINEDWKIVKNKKALSDLFFSVDEKIIKETVSTIKSGKYDFIFSNLSEMGDAALSGDFGQTISAVEKTSLGLKKIANAVLEEEGTLIVLGAYGAAEDVFNVNTKISNFSKTSNPVPFLIVGKDYQGKTIGLEEAPNNDLSLIKTQGDFSDIAPTVLKIMGLDIYPEMTGESFV
ncbi:hypothetical protein CVU82_00705 [Candidatus Falkowbacteria bacterium HGW-Falkowbacteria-1]|jgi:2,3-bisphosphoglycerate-independent phosphoglycerate mutase|uniref:Metalloenzyme domain-containing protein n=1 Tax=Candidatus Falkowbacteria bacterium HGW-Falkowbacteria-1 TaxID=2013768 RepID=A0A2N2EAF0_9BACT|nr:MAG: hypothetical protein CVU82_00705 [Candidatus Falkowbacteria bacterium HGW-Falkowbacteria-1]